MSNQLLNPKIVMHDIDFSDIKPTDFVEAFDKLIPEVKLEQEFLVLEALLDYEQLFENLPKREQLGSVVHLLSHINGVIQTPEIREIYNKYMPEISSFFQEISLDSRVYEKVKKYMETVQYQDLSDLHKKIIKDIIFNYELHGINLPEEKKKVLKENAAKSTELTNKFDNNLTDVEASLEMTVELEELKGLSERALNNVQKVEDKYVISKSAGTYSDILSYCDIAETRKKIYEQQLDLGVREGFDNRPILREIVKLKHKYAQILSFSNYANLALVKQMVKKPIDALSFIQNLSEKSFEGAKKEGKEINTFGEKILGHIPNFSDRSYIVEKMQKELFTVDSEKMRQYFPVKKVISGLFLLIENLYEVKFSANNKSVWHEDVTSYNVVDLKTGKEIGYLYMDLYKRKFKSSGAWLDPAVARHINKKELRLPVAYIVCNAPKDVGQEPTFEFDEIITLFHEMGHCLHHLLTEVDVEYYSGINNVEHDAVELPSQFMENFCWDYQILENLSQHTVTGETLPKSEYDKIIAMKNFMGASAMLRQASFSEIDMRIYNEPESDPVEIEREVFTKWATRKLDSRAYFIPNFSHIFAGGYSAGYYAYKWAEVLSADAFSALKESGSSYMEQKEAAHRFRKIILARGGAEDMEKNFIEFRGRKPDVKFLLIDSGIIAK